MSKVMKENFAVGTTLYRVKLMQTALVEKLAKAEGWTEGESYWDYIDPICNDAVRYASFKTFAEAEAHARKNAGGDIYSSPEIVEILLVEEVIEGTRFKEWEPQKRWLLDDGEIVEIPDAYT